MATLLDMLARNALAAAILAGLVLLASTIIKRPAVRNALWLIVVVRLLVPPVWSVPLVGAPASEPATVAESVRDDTSFDVIPAATAPRAATMSQLGSEPQVRMVSSEIGVPRVFPQTSRQVAVPRAEQPNSKEALVATNPVADEIVPPSAWRWPAWISPALFVCWAGGALVVISLAVRRIRRFQHGLRDAIRAPESVQLDAAEIAAQLGIKHCPPIWIVPGRIPPLLWMPGLSSARAMLVFPSDLFFKLEPVQRGALIAHELAHLRRRDPWVRWLELIAVTLYWWHPLLGLIRRRLRESEEQCCDAWVVAILAGRKAYATALVETVDFLSGPAVPAAPALASGASPVHDLQRRLTMIMRGSIQGGLSRLGVLAILGVAMGALAFGPAFSNAQPDEPKEKKGRPFKKGGFDRNKGGGEDSKDQPAPSRNDANDELEKARQELNKANEEAQKAIQRVRELQERLQKIAESKEGGDRRGPPAGEPKDNPPQPPFNRDPRRVPMGDPKDGPPQFPPFGRGPLGIGGPMGPDRQIQEMQKQIDEMKKTLDDIRKELRGANTPSPSPKDAPPLGGKGGVRPPFGGQGGGGGFPGGRPGQEREKEKLPPPREKDD